MYVQLDQKDEFLKFAENLNWCKDLTLKTKVEENIHKWTQNVHNTLMKSKIKKQNIV